MSLFQLNAEGTVSVHGNLDRDTLAKDFWAMLSASEKSTLTSNGSCLMDLGNVERVDSAGLAWLINAIRHARAQNVSISLADMPEKLQQLAKISDVDTLLPTES